MSARRYQAHAGDAGREGPEELRYGRGRKIRWSHAASCPGSHPILESTGQPRRTECKIKGAG